MQLLFQSISSDTANSLVCTPNQRLAQFLLNQYQQWQQQQAAICWHTPKILAWENWLQILWSEYQWREPSNPQILSPFAEQVLWQQIIRQSDHQSALLNVNRTAQLANQAWRQLALWEQTESFAQHHAEWQESEDRQAFQIWAQEFQQICLKNRQISVSSITSELVLANAKDKLKLPKNIWLVGFQDFTPQQKTWLNNCEQVETKIIYHDLVVPQAKCYQYNADSPKQELQQAIHWAKQCLAKKAASIGIVVPNLSQMRELATTLVHEANIAHCTDISAPIPLTEYAFIDTAILLLELAKPTIDVQSLSLFLRSPFIAHHDTEQCAKVELLVKLTRLQCMKISWEQVLEVVTQFNQEEPRLTNLSVKIAQWQVIITKITKAKSAQQWCNQFTQMLACWGWLETHDNSELSQHLVKTWQRVLEQFANLPTILGKLSYQSAISTLRFLAQQTPFLPKQTNANIQILGLLEGTGTIFDYLWVSNMQAEAWPMEVKPNPFIPIQLQRRWEMPHSSAKRELEVAIAITRQLKQSAKQVVFSRAAIVDEQPTTMSKLLLELPVYSNAIKPPDTYKKSIELEEMSDEQGVQISQQHAQATSHILKWQAACPFRAYATYRLGAQPQVEKKIGLSAAERGSMLHEILAKLAKPNMTQQQFIQQVTLQLGNITQSTINAVISKWKHRITGVDWKYFVAVELKRLQPLLNSWLAVEAARDPYTIESVEVAKQVKIGPLLFNLRLDRVDKLENNQLLLLDYKTGTVSLSAWFGTHLADPQLPLYCVSLSDQRLAGAVMLQIQAEAITAKGIAEEPIQISGVLPMQKLSQYQAEETLSQQVTTWFKQLEQLAQQYAKGIATVSPVNGGSTCRGCHLPTLCRVQELACN